MVRDWKPRKEKEGALNEATHRRIKGQRYLGQLAAVWERSHMCPSAPSYQRAPGDCQGRQTGTMGLDTVYN